MRFINITIKIGDARADHARDIPPKGLASKELVG